MSDLSVFILPAQSAHNCLSLSSLPFLSSAASTHSEGTTIFLRCLRKTMFTLPAGNTYTYCILRAFVPSVIGPIRPCISEHLFHKTNLPFSLTYHYTNNQTNPFSGNINCVFLCEGGLTFCVTNISYFKIKWFLPHLCPMYIDSTFVASKPHHRLEHGLYPLQMVGMWDILPGFHAGVWISSERTFQ